MSEQKAGPREVCSAADAESVRAMIEDIVDQGWGRDPDTGRFDWEEFFNRLERYHDLDFGSDWTTPAIRKAKAIARAAAAEVDD